jgi:hypothetical protein
VGSLINSIECGNALGSIALISRNEQSDLIETKCNAKNGITALGAACASNDVEAMKRLMSMNADPEVFDRKGRALFHVACATGSLHVVQEIVKDHTFWHKKYGKIGAKNLLRDGPSNSVGEDAVAPPPSSRKQQQNIKRVHPIKMKDQNERSGLRWAMKGNHYEVVEFILNHGGKIESDLMEWMEDHKDDMLALKLKKKVAATATTGSGGSGGSGRGSRSRSSSRSGSRRSRSRSNTYM